MPPGLGYGPDVQALIRQRMQSQMQPLQGLQDQLRARLQAQMGGMGRPGMMGMTPDPGFGQAVSQQAQQIGPAIANPMRQWAQQLGPSIAQPIQQFAQGLGPQIQSGVQQGLQGGFQAQAQNPLFPRLQANPGAIPGQPRPFQPGMPMLQHLLQRRMGA